MSESWASRVTRSINNVNNSLLSHLSNLEHCCDYIQQYYTTLIIAIITTKVNIELSLSLLNELITMTNPSSTPLLLGVENENNNGTLDSRPDPHTTSTSTSTSTSALCNISGGGIILIKNIKKILSLMASPITDETGSRKSVVAGLTTIIVAGTCIGLATPKNPVLTPPYQSISAALGYIYFMAWRWV